MTDSLLLGDRAVDTLILGAHVATMTGAEPYGAVFDGAVAVQDGRIIWVGAQDSLPSEAHAQAKEIIQLDGGWLTPGLIDCHTHLVYGGQRSLEFAMRLHGRSYEEIAAAGGGIVSTVEATRKASESELLESARWRLRERIKQGCTVVEIKSGYGLDVETELKMLRVARILGEVEPVTVKTTFLGAHAIPPDYKENRAGYIDLICNEMLPAVAEAGLADAVDGFCESIGFTRDEIARVFDAAQSLGLPVKLHAEQLTNQEGASLAAAYGALSADHLEHLSEEGVMAMAQAGTVAVMLPAAYYFLQDTHRPPIDWLRRAGVPIAIATDGNPGTAPTSNLLLMLNMACTLFGMTPEEALRGVTQHAATALGMQHSHGTIEQGKAADLVHWNIQDPAELAYHIGENLRGAHWVASKAVNTAC